MDGRTATMRSSLLAAVGAAATAAAVVALVRYRRARRRAQLRRLCELLPKAELHAHLHGCCRLQTHRLDLGHHGASVGLC